MERLDSQAQIPIAPIDVELAGQRLLLEMDAACEACETFPEQVVAVLRAALERFAAESDLSCLLAAPPDSALLAQRQVHWQQIFAARLRGAARRRAEVPAPPMFLERTLMISVCTQIGAWLAAGELRPLDARVATLAELILASYPEPTMEVAHD